MACPTCLAIQAILEATGMDPKEAKQLSHSAAAKRLDKKVVKKVKRGASAYNKKFARMYKKLKKKHPRMSFGALAKKAHRALRGKKR